MYDQAGAVGRVRYDKGDCEIAVQWFQRDVSGGDERRIFKLWAADEEASDPGPANKVYTFNSTQLRAINIEMRLLQPVGGVPLQQVRPSRAATQVALTKIRNIICRKQQLCATPPAQLWEISAGSEGLILTRCCA